MSAAKKKLDTDQVVSDLSESAFFQPASTQVHKPTSVQEDKYTKYTTHLLPWQIKAIKRWAFEHDMKDYEVVEAAILAFLKEQKAKEQSL
jgi:flagellar capping protein FliD